MLDQFIKDEDGSTMIEYGMVLFLIVAVAVAAAALLGPATLEMFEKGASLF